MPHGTPYIDPRRTPLSTPKTDALHRLQSVNSSAAVYVNAFDVLAVFKGPQPGVTMLALKTGVTIGTLADTDEVAKEINALACGETYEPPRKRPPGPSNNGLHLP